jgi:hypothetical protein
MQKTVPSVLRVAALMLGCLSLTTSPACTASRVISAKIDFVTRAHKSGLDISVDASVTLLKDEISDSSPSPSDTATVP